MSTATETCMSYPTFPLSSSSNRRSKSIEEENAVFADLGILLEGSLPSTLKRFEYPNPSASLDQNATNTKNSPDCSKKSIKVALHVVDDDPGAIQSGHCLWPAAPALCDYLTRRTTTKAETPAFRQPRSILELGAGCALVSLVAWQLYAQTLQCLVITDRDPTTLVRARDSYESTLEALHEDAETEEEQLDYCINLLGSIPVEFESLDWETERKLLEDSMNDIMANHMILPDLPPSPPRTKDNHPTDVTPTSASTDTRSASATKMDMILGSDLIYCAEVVEPLFKTASSLMHDDSVFILSQSFAYDDETEEAIEKLCEKFKLDRTICTDDLKDQSGGGVRIQEFTRSKCEQHEEKE